MTIVDQYGDPVSSSSLLMEHVDEESRFLSPARESRATGLTPEKLGRLFRAADDGDVEAYLTLAEEIEERDAHYRSVLFTRKAVLSQLRPEVEAVDETPEQQAIASDVKWLVEADEFRDLLFHGADGIAKGYAFVENLWETSESQWWPADYRWRDPRWYRVNPRTLRGYRLEDGSAEGAQLPAHKYTVFQPLLKSGVPLRNGLARLVAASYLCKSLTVKDLMRYLEAYGIPSRIGYHASGGTDSTNDTKASFARAMRMLGTHGYAIFPDGVKLETLPAQKGSEAGAFLGTAQFWDQQTSKAVLGQTSSADGGGAAPGTYKAAEHHKGVRLDYLKHDARTMIAIVAKQLIRAFVSFNHGPQERYPRVTLPVPDHADIAKFSTAVYQLVDRGLEVDQDQILERLGLARPVEGAKLLRPSTQHDLDGQTGPGGEPEEGL
ncbi:MAG: DUF935 family protein [Myxococcota bacterium]